MPTRPLTAALVAVASLAVADVAHAGRTAGQLAAACSPSSPTSTPSAPAGAARFARCVVREVRRDAGRRTRFDDDLARGARRAIAAGVRGTGATGRARVTAEVLRGARASCPRGARATGRWVAADSSRRGGARTLVQLARVVLRARRPLAITRRGTRLAVAARRGRLLRGGRSGAVAVLVAGATCGG